MRDAVARILTYAAGLSFDEFAADPKTVDAVVRNFEVLGEAARHVDDATQRLAPGIPCACVRAMVTLTPPYRISRARLHIKNITAVDRNFEIF